MPDNKNIFGGYEVFSLVDSNRYNDTYGDVIDNLGKEEVAYIRKKLIEQKAANRILVSEEQNEKVDERAALLARLLSR